MYAYVGNDTVNWTDPLGLQTCGGGQTHVNNDGGAGAAGCGDLLASYLASIVITGTRPPIDHSKNTPDPQQQIDNNQLKNDLQNQPSRPFNPRQASQKVRKHIQNIQQCKTQACSAKAWKDYDEYRTTAEFQMLMEENYRSNNYWLGILVKGIGSLSGARLFGQTLGVALGLFGLSTVGDKAIECTVSGGHC